MSSPEVRTGEPVHVESGDHLESVVAEGGVVLVDYYADWCGPCKMLEPTVEALAADGDLTVLKVDIDELQAVAREAGVRSVPTLEFYVDGERDRRLVGVQDEATLREIVAELS